MAVEYIPVPRYCDRFVFEEVLAIRHFSLGQVSMSSGAATVGEHPFWESLSGFDSIQKQLYGYCDVHGVKSVSTRKGASIRRRSIDRRSSWRNAF